MIVLGLDTALAACSAAVVDGGRTLAARREPMLRGHQERLALMVQSVMAEAGLDFAALDRIAVTVGPGSFTGLRVGLAFAKAMALALGRPCIGIGSLEALAAGAGPGLVAAVIDAKRGQVCLQVFVDDQPVMAPDVLPIGVAVARLVELGRGGPMRLIGSGGGLFAGLLTDAEVRLEETPDPVAIAHLAQTRSAGAGPRPLYLRPPDAKLPGGIDPAP